MPIDVHWGRNPQFFIPGVIEFASALAMGDVDQDGRSELLVGAPNNDGDVGAEGHVYLYPGLQVPSASVAADSYEFNHIEWEADAADLGGARFGRAVLLADVTGDVAPVAIVGAPGDAFGMAFVFENVAGQLHDQPMWKISSEPVDSKLGASLAAGDFNGDTYADLAVGEPYPSGGPDAGRVRVFLGTAAGLPLVEDLVLAPTISEGAEFGPFGEYGWALAAGDVDADGWPDLAVGAPGASTGLAVGVGWVLVNRGVPVYDCGTIP